MALNAAIVWDIRTTATAGNVNGGGFKTGATGTDFSKQDAAQYNITTGASAGAGAVILHASAANDMVGNIGHLISGTNATAGWYEITAVSVGVSITVDRNCTSGVGANIIFNIGGALPLDGSADNAWIQIPVAGNKIYVKSGNYTPQNMSSATLNGTATNPISIIGYQTTRDDNPTSFANCPKWAFTGASGMGLVGTYWYISYMVMEVGAANGINMGEGAKVVRCKMTNSSTTANRSAVTIDSGIIYDCEIISYRGRGVHIPLNGSFGSIVADNYIHHCNVGINFADTAEAHTAIGNIIHSCVTSAIAVAQQGPPGLINGNTLYGSENTTGIGVSGSSAASHGLIIVNNIIYGFATGVSLSGTNKSHFDDYNDYYNNDTDVSNWTKGSNSIALNPVFTGVGQITGTNGTTSGSVLTSSGADFSAVVDNEDFVRLVSGTGVTAGIYKITGHTTTTLTLDIAPGTNATADKVFEITTGKNFAIGTNLKAAGNPGIFKGGLTRSYRDIGAVQRQEAGGGSGMLYTPGLEGLG